jgi:hypothetical protein
MRTIPVETHPLTKAFGSAVAAIKGAINHPLQPKARADSTRLEGTTIVDAFWTDTDFVIRFSNEFLLHVSVEHEGVRWSVSPVPPHLTETSVERVGAPAAMFRWKPHVGDHIMDRSELVAKRRGRPFQRLYANEMGLLVYCESQLILAFAAIRRTDFNRSLLFVSEMD